MIDEKDPMFLMMLSNPRESIRPTIRISEGMALIHLIDGMDSSGLLLSMIGNERRSKALAFRNTLVDLINKRYESNKIHIFIEETKVEDVDKNWEMIQARLDLIKEEERLAAELDPDVSDHPDEVDDDA